MRQVSIRIDTVFLPSLGQIKVVGAAGSWDCRFAFSLVITFSQRVGDEIYLCFDESFFVCG
jgi:hypothetical protein